MTITRDLINKNIKYHDLCRVNINKSPQIEFMSADYDYEYLSSLVDAYKNVFLSKGVKPNQSVVIGTQARIEQIALVLACSELGIVITIVDVDVVLDPRGPLVLNEHKKENRELKPVSELITDAYKKLLPIDFFVVKNRNCTAKFDVFKETCNTTIVLDDEKLDYTNNNTILATSDSVFLNCAGVDINGNVKVIEHTHDFIAALIKRNANMFYGKMSMMSNLNHGSSPAVYFLPGLVSEKVTDIYNLREVIRIPPEMLFNYLNKIPLNHFMVPYTQYLDELFANIYRVNINDCTIYTLGLIRQDWVNRLKHKAKNIISIFGSRETSGPTLINQAIDVDFAENSYKKLDDFYGIKITDDGLLDIEMPVYNTVVHTKDVFTVKDNKYIHNGRNDLYRVNDQQINVTVWQNKIDALIKAKLLVDTLQDRIYLAVYDSSDNKEVQEIDRMLRSESNNRHFISKYEFLTDSSLDNNSLIDYFRSKF